MYDALNSDYYIWLLDRIGVLNGEYKNYELLAQHLFSTKYIYMFAMDENRAKGGLALRTLYAQTAGVYVEDVHEGPCNVLEMIESLAEKISFDHDDTIQRWFWEMLDNLNLLNYSNEFYDPNAVQYILDTWMYRRYDSSGNGSLFPVPDYEGDMRNIETWDQMNIYLTRFYPITDNWLN